MTISRFLCALRFSFLVGTALAALLIIGGCSRTPSPPTSVSASDEWHQFQGTWTAAGSRNSISLGSDRRASIAKLEGSLVLTGPSRPAIGFRAEALLLNDNATGTIGRAVWTDEHGEQVFSELTGQGTSTGSYIAGTFLGGTGRYAGATGSYEFSWRFVLETEDGTVRGQSEDLTGKIRVGSAPPAADAGASR